MKLCKYILEGILNFCLYQIQILKTALILIYIQNKQIKMISVDRLGDNLELARLYTQFKSDKIKQYKIQFPSISNKQITTKIVKEWNKYTLQQQRNYKTIDIANNDGLNMNSIGKPITPNKSPDLNQIGSTNSKKKSPLTPQKQVQINQFEQFDDHIEKSMKKKAINKDSKDLKSDYIQFYKNHYSQYSRDHPRWTSQQISIIIKLLWKNRNTATNNRNHKINFNVNQDAKIHKNMSAKMAFMKSGANNTDQTWKKLPFQSKKFWQNKCDSAQDEKMMDEDQTLHLPRKQIGLQFMNWK